MLKQPSPTRLQDRTLTPKSMRRRPGSTDAALESISYSSRPRATAPAVIGSSRVEVDRLIRKHIRRGECVVELGCASGGNLGRIAAAVGPTGRIIAVDSSPDAIHRLRGQPWLRNEKHISVFLSRGDSLPMEPSTVDVIFCQGLVAPSGHRQMVYREMLRVLRPGGTILVHDIVVHKLLPPEIADSVAAFSSGLAGAIEAASYRLMLEKLDLRDITLTHCPSPDLLHDLLIPSAQSAAGHRSDSSLADLRSVLPDFISVVRIGANKSPAAHD